MVKVLRLGVNLKSKIGREHARGASERADTLAVTMKLDDHIHSQIVKFAEQGNNACDAGDFDKAVELFQKGLDLLPVPIEIWDAATWLLAGIGDAYFLSGKMESALPPLLGAMRCPRAVGNSFLHLRLGQVQFELGNLIRAADELTRAYMGEGTKIFEGEDSKYFEFLKTKIKSPPEGW